MQQDESELLAIEIATPDIFKEWQRHAETNPAWRDYFLLLNAFGEALRRAPYSREKGEH